MYIERNLAHVHEGADLLVVLERERVVFRDIVKRRDGARTHRIPKTFAER